MPKRITPPHPSLARLLEELGENIRLARLRRNLTAAQVAERAGTTRATLRSVEHGAPSVSMGIYANVLHVLDLHRDLALVARDDDLGRKLQDAELTTKERASRRRR